MADQQIFRSSRSGYNKDPLAEEIGIFTRAPLLQQQTLFRLANRVEAVLGLLEMSPHTEREAVCRQLLLRIDDMGDVVHDGNEDVVFRPPNPVLAGNDVEVAAVDSHDM